MTALLAKFSEAIKMMLFRCRSSSDWIASAISGSSMLKGLNQITGILSSYQDLRRCNEVGKIDYGEIDYRMQTSLSFQPAGLFSC